MTDYQINNGVRYAWLILAIAAILGAFFKGAWHQLSIAAIAVLMYFITKPKVHIPTEIYMDIQEQIQNALNGMEDNHRILVVNLDLADEMVLDLKIDMQQKETKTKFRDGAWGAMKMFTETNWECVCDITDVHVFDKYGHELPSDFDEDRLDLEFEVTDWK